ncbi:MAG: hypothetical protein EA399_11120 [Desulfovibrionales bacterium]|nr:MAG: hypothetical protein EA399_11120 [Desulfovibrionales bacterium]
MKEFRAVPNRASQPSLQEKFGENKNALHLSCHGLALSLQTFQKWQVISTRREPAPCLQLKNHIFTK